MADVELNPDNTECMFMSRGFNEGPNRDIKQRTKFYKLLQISNF